MRVSDRFFAVLDMLLICDGFALPLENFLVQALEVQNLHLQEQNLDSN